MSTAPAPRPRASLRRVIDHLGATLLDLVHGVPDDADAIGGVVIHDPLDAPVLPPHALVLGVGLESPEHVAAVLADLGGAGAAGLVLRSPCPVTDEVRAASDDAGVAVLGLSRGAPWAHLAAMLRSLLAEGDVGGAEQESLGGLPSGDLFAVANAVAALLDAPITIEDRSSRVLAFSERQGEADPSRVETILGRQVPERYARILSERGVFGELHRSDQPVYISPAEDDAFLLPRVAIAVRAGEEVLGSIWAAVHAPLSPERTQAFREAATLTALHLLRARAGSDVQRRVRTDLVSSVLEGGIGAQDSLARLGLADVPLVVLALTVAGGGEAGDPSRSQERERLADAFAVHLSAMNPRSATALLGGTAYGIAATSSADSDADERVVATARDFVDRIGDRTRPLIAVGPIASTPAGVARSRATADRVLRVLRERHDSGGRRSGPAVARLADVHTDLLLLDLRDLASAQDVPPTGPLARLVDYDARHASSLVPTLRAWLEAFGDVNEAAEALFVHPNTFRYRLRRVREVGQVDLRDHRQRLALMLQLALRES
ncbi:helix-turn-helix domain-containing protein [Nocardioides sp. C4-1]|uniref:PucR family transcriptional regulator n=1 Tax=Nocardioides sp. C4-1 TaxID=3151851 RepID=UPI0032673B41